jgi:desulfoferrodoxin (superoxide reductase-like protein)
MGDTVISCCGTMLPPLEAEDIDDAHEITIEKVEDEHFITVHHDMTKSHFISFLAYLTSDRIQFVKFYPEGNAETRFQLRGRGYLYVYCNKHGLMKTKI